MTISLAMFREARCAASAAVCTILSVMVTDAALAQGWPTRSIQVIIPFNAGNANDILGRIVLDQISRQLGQTIIIDNRSGGGTTLGVNAVAKALGSVEIYGMPHPSPLGIINAGGKDAVDRGWRLLAEHFDNTREQGIDKADVE